MPRESCHLFFLGANLLSLTLIVNQDESLAIDLTKDKLVLVVRTPLHLGNFEADFHDLNQLT